MVQSSHRRWLRCSGQNSSLLLSHDIKYEGIKSEHTFKHTIRTTILQPSTESTKQSVTQLLQQKLQCTTRWIPFKDNTQLQPTHVLNFDQKLKILGHLSVPWKTTKTYKTTCHVIVSWIQWWLYDQSVYNRTLYWVTVKWHYTNQLLTTCYVRHQTFVTYHTSQYFSKKLQP